MSSARTPGSSRLVVRACAFASLLAMLVWGLGELVRAFVPWVALQDPRRRLLWEEDLSRWRVFLLGDSVFCSDFVDRPEEAVWARMSVLLNEDVFAGALNGATEEHIVEEARLVARAKGTQGGVGFLDVVAMRFVVSSEHVGGNTAAFDKALARRYAGRLRFPCTLAELETWLEYGCTRPFFLLRNREATEAVVRAAAHTPRYFRTGDNRVWSESGDFARERFERALKRKRASKTAPSLDWVLQACGAMRAAGMRPVVVVYPLNRPLLNEYLGEAEAAQLYGEVSRGRDAETARLRALGIDAIDLLDAVPSEGFADLDHTNTRGDGIVAEALSSWLLRAERASRGPVVR
jgi:hypothetical protein